MISELERGAVRQGAASSAGVFWRQTGRWMNKSKKSRGFDGLKVF